MLSTESEAAAWARAGAPEGAFVVAGYQASPRGRAGISWQVDHHHDLAFSLILRPQLPALREGGWRGESSFAHIRALRSYVRRPPRDAKSRPGAAWSRKLFPREPLDEGRVGAIPTLPLSPCSRYEVLPMLPHSNRTRSRRPPPGARLSPSRAPPRLPAHRSRSRSRTLPPRPVLRSPRSLRPRGCPPSVQAGQHQTDPASPSFSTMRSSSDLISLR